MVDRCSPVRMEARGSPASQNSFKLSLSNSPNTKFPDSEEAAIRLPRVCDLSRSGAVRKWHLLHNALIDGTQRL